MHVVKIRAIGNSLGLVLPKEVLDRRGIAKDDEVYLVETTEGLELRVYNPEVADQVDRGRELAKKYRTALRELAK